MKNISPWNRSSMDSLIISLLTVVGTLRCGAAPVSDGLVVLAMSRVSVQRGHTTTLPCWLNPSQNAEGLEVRWYRGDDHFDSPVMLYQQKKYTYKVPSYVGRVLFGLKDAASGGLMAGDVSLKLENATLEDAGDYTCYASSDQGYESARVSLTVTETGSPLLLSAAWKEDNMVNVSCESEGWYPKPTLRWSDQKQPLSPQSVKYRNDSSGLLSVHSWLLISSPSEVSCSVGLSGEETKEARVRLDKPAAGSVAGSVASAVLAILLIATLAGLAVLWFKERAKKNKSESGNSEEKQELLPKGVIQPTDLTEARKHSVVVTLDKTENPYLKFSESDRCILRDDKDKVPQGAEVSCLTAIKGTSGFSSGQHYWEVSTGNANVGPKESWWLGVTSATDIPKEPGFIPTASGRFWFLSSSPDRVGNFLFSDGAELKVLLPVCSRPMTVGVYLNYDSGELSFYDVEKKYVIGSVMAMFKGEEVFPLFNPGVGDTAPMEILHNRQEQGQSSDTRNSVDSTAQETGS